MLIYGLRIFICNQHHPHKVRTIRIMMHDLIIIGGGPGGCAAGIYAARKKIDALLLTDVFGGQSVVSDDIQNWIGVPHLSGVEMADRLKEHLKSAGAFFKEGVKVNSAKKIENGFEVGIEGGTIYRSKTVLITAGSVRRKLNIPGEDRYGGRGVFYCTTCDAPLMKGKIAAMIGSGNAAVEGVIDLSSYASKIYLLVRSDSLKADPVSVEKIKNDPKVEIIFNAETKEVRGEKFVGSLIYADKKSSRESDIKIDGLFVEIGARPNTDFLKGLVALNERGEIAVDCRTQKTGVEGIWAAGDITDGLYRQSSISMGDAVVALLNIYDYLKGLA